MRILWNSYGLNSSNCYILSIVLFRNTLPYFLKTFDHDLEQKRKKDFPCGSTGKESACNMGDLDLIPRLGRSPREGKGYPLHYSVLENSMDCVACGVVKSRTWLSDFHFHFSLYSKNTFANLVPQALSTGTLNRNKLILILYKAFRSFYFLSVSLSCSHGSFSSKACQDLLN